MTKQQAIQNPKKLTSKAICGAIALPSAKKSLYTVFGIVASIRTRETDFGESQEFHGTFKATNLETGEIFLAPKAFFPDEMTTQLMLAKKPNVPLEFSFEVGIMPSESEVGYSYWCNSLVEMSVSDPLAALEAKMIASQNKAKTDKK